MGCPTKCEKSVGVSFYCLHHILLGASLSHQLSTCSAISLPSKIDDIGSDDELEDVANHEYDNNDEDEDDDEEGLLAYDDEEYNSDGDSRSKSEADILSDGVEHQQAYSNRLLAGIRSSDRKIGQRYVHISSENQAFFYTRRCMLA